MSNDLNEEKEAFLVKEALEKDFASFRSNTFSSFLVK